MRLVRGFVALGVLLSVGLAVPANAEPLPPADLAVWATTTQGDSGVGKTVLAKLAAVDYGPNAVSYGKVTREVIAPSGTEIVNHFDASCTWVVPKRRVKCMQSGGFLVYSGGNFVNIWSIYLKITSPYVKPGRQTISWEGTDPKLSNNSAPIRVAGMPTASPKPPTPKATPSSSAKASPSAVDSASPAAIATEPVTAVELSSEAAPIVAEPASSSSSGMSAGGFIVGGIVVLLGVALLAGVLWRGRNRSAQEEWDEAAIVDDSRFGQNGGS